MKLHPQHFVLERGVRNFTRIMAYLSSLPKDKRIKITIEEATKERSSQQNKALWGCAYKAIMEATGNDKEDLHDYFCGSYWGWDLKDVMGMKKKVPKRTTTTDFDGKRDVISTIHLKEFYEFVQRRAAEVAGVFVPDPDPMWFEHEEERRHAA